MTARLIGLRALCDFHSSVTWEDGLPQRIDFTVEEFARMAEGSPLLLRDLGWTSVASTARPRLTEDQITKDARTALLPDGGEAPREEHPWAELSTILRGKGIPATADQLRELPYEIVLGPRVRAYLSEPS